MRACPECGKEEGYSQVYTNVTIYIPIEVFIDPITDEEDVFLHEEGDKIDYDYTHSDISYRCNNCGWIIPLDTVDDVIAWIKGDKFIDPVDHMGYLGQMFSDEEENENG